MRYWFMLRDLLFNRWWSYTILLFTLLELAACKSKTPDATTNNTVNSIDSNNKDTLSESEEQRVYDKLEKLPEVKQAELYIDSFSNHKHGIAFITANEPEKDHYYVIQAGYNGELRFETVYVYPPSLVVKYYDVVNDTVISLDTWRNDKRRLLPYYQQKRY